MMHLISLYLHLELELQCHCSTSLDDLGFLSDFQTDLTIAHCKPPSLSDCRAVLLMRSRHEIMMQTLLIYNCICQADHRRLLTSYSAETFCRIQLQLFCLSLPLLQMCLFREYLNSINTKKKNHHLAVLNVRRIKFLSPIQRYWPFLQIVIKFQCMCLGDLRSPSVSTDRMFYLLLPLT